MSETKMPPLPKTLPGDLSSEVDGSIKVVPPTKGVEVKALQRGYIYQDRREPGDVFMVTDLKHLDEWMECTDPTEQKRHLARLEERKKAQREKQAAGK
jgi:hypothetical protein